MQNCKNLSPSAQLPWIWGISLPAMINIQNHIPLLQKQNPTTSHSLRGLQARVLRIVYMAFKPGFFA